SAVKNDSLHAGGPARAGVMDDGFSAGFDHHLCKCRPGTDTFATALRCYPNASWHGQSGPAMSLARSRLSGSYLDTTSPLLTRLESAFGCRARSEVSRLFRFSRDSSGRRRIITQQPRPKAARNLKRVGALSEAS